MKRWLSVVMLSVACGGGSEPKTDETQCRTGESLNPVTGSCEADSDAGVSRDTGEASSDMSRTSDLPNMEPDMGDDGGVDMASMPDMNVRPDMDAPPGDWPPPIDSLHSPGACNLPACDENGDSGVDTSGMWVTTLTTLESDCSDFIKQQDQRANEGNVDVSEPAPLGNWTGQCEVDDAMQHVATAMEGIAATCARNDQQFGVVSFETSVIEYVGETGTGEAYVYLENVPAVVGADCFMRFDVLQERQ